MNQDYNAELQAKETLNILSYCDALRHWEDFNNLPKIKCLTSKSKNTSNIQKERSIKQNTTINKTVSGRLLKPLLIPKKPIFQQRTQLIKNERRIKDNTQIRKKVISKVSKNFRTLEENNDDTQSNKQQLNLMRFWFQHRFEQNSMNNLIYKIQQKRKGLRSVLN